MTFPAYRIVGGPRTSGTKIIDSITGHELRGVKKLTLIADPSDPNGLWRAEIVLLGVEVDATVPNLPGHFTVGLKNANSPCPGCGSRPQGDLLIHQPGCEVSAADYLARVEGRPRQ